MLPWTRPQHAARDLLRLAEPADRDLRDDVLLQHVLRHRHHHLGGDVAGADRVDGDTLRRVLQRQRLGEAEIAGLRRGIVRLAELALLAVDRRDVDHSTPAPLGHALDQRLGAVVHRVQVDLDDRRPLVRGHLAQGVVTGDAGAVDQDVDRAALGLHFGQGRLGRRVVCDITFRHCDFDAFGPHGRRPLVRGRIAGELEGGNGLAAAGVQRFDDGGADGSHAPGNQCDAIFHCSDSR